jgi:hypothetical protein
MCRVDILDTHIVSVWSSLENRVRQPPTLVAPAPPLAQLDDSNKCRQRKESGPCAEALQPCLLLRLRCLDADGGGGHIGRCFRGMLQAFHTDVAKINRDVCICCKSLSPMFHLFFKCMLQVSLFGCCYIFAHMLQVFYVDVVYVCNVF